MLISKHIFAVCIFISGIVLSLCARIATHCLGIITEKKSSSFLLNDEQNVSEINKKIKWKHNYILIWKMAISHNKKCSIKMKIITATEKIVCSFELVSNLQTVSIGKRFYGVVRLRIITVRAMEQRFANCVYKPIKLSHVLSGITGKIMILKPMNINKGISLF